MNKQLIREYIKKYYSQFLNELYDSPLDFFKSGDFEYKILLDGDVLAIVSFRNQYDIDRAPIDHKKFSLSKYWDVSWKWGEISDKLKTTSNFIKVTSTLFKIVYSFISNISPDIISFSGLTESHERIYSNESFLERWRSLLSEKYNVSWSNDRVWIVKKSLSPIDEYKVMNLAEHLSISPSEAYKKIVYPNKKELKGITKNELIKEQIKILVLKHLYLK